MPAKRKRGDEETRGPHDDRRPGRARPQSQEHLARDSPRRARGRHWTVGIRQVQPRLRHHLRRRPAPLHGVAVDFRQAVRRPGDQARCRLRLRAVAGDLDRAEDAREQPAVDGRHDDRYRQLPQSSVRDDRAAALPAQRRGDTKPQRQSDSRGDPRAARRRRDRAARADLQGLRRGPRLRLHRGAQERLPPRHRRRQAGRPGGEDGSRRRRRARHRRRGRSLHRRAEAREGHQGRHRRDAARRRRFTAGACGARREQGGSGTFLQGARQPDASLRLRRYRPGVFRLQQSRERVPHVRRARRRQAHAPGAADTGSASAASSADASCAKRSSTTPIPGTAG